MFHVNPPSRAITQITTTLIFWGLLLSIAAAQDGDIKTAAQLVKVRKHHDDTVWASEVEAQEYENTFVGLWDSLIHGKDKFAVLREFNFNRINLPQDVKEEAFDHDIVRKQGSTSKAIDRAEFVNCSTSSRRRATRSSRPSGIIKNSNLPRKTKPQAPAFRCSCT